MILKFNKKIGIKKNVNNENLCKYVPEIASSLNGPGFLLSKLSYPKTSLPVKNCKITSSETNNEQTAAEIKKNFNFKISFIIKYLKIK